MHMDHRSPDCLAIKARSREIEVLGGSSFRPVWEKSYCVSYSQRQNLLEFGFPAL